MGKTILLSNFFFKKEKEKKKQRKGENKDKINAIKKEHMGEKQRKKVRKQHRYKNLMHSNLKSPSKYH